MNHRIYTKCPACDHDTLTINDDKHLLCTWVTCPDPTLIDRIGEAFATTIKVRDEWCAEYVKARDALLKIREAVEGFEDGAPDIRELSEKVKILIREVIADDDENRSDL